MSGDFAPPPPPSMGSGSSSSDDNTMAVLAHVGGILLSFIAPLIIMLTKGANSPYVRRQAVEALNFQITLVIGWLATFVLSIVVIGLIGYVVLPILTLIFCIMAAVAASKGEEYRYPINIRLVK